MSLPLKSQMHSLPTLINNSNPTSKKTKEASKNPVKLRICLLVLPSANVLSPLSKTKTDQSFQRQMTVPLTQTFLSKKSLGPSPLKFNKVNNKLSLMCPILSWSSRTTLHRVSNHWERSSFQTTACNFRALWTWSVEASLLRRLRTACKLCRWSQHR